MSVSLADTYYLKALDLYPYELDQVIEALNYAIGYDNDHAGAHYLLGMLNMYQLGNYGEAENNFEKALTCDLNHAWTYYSYINLLIQTGEYGRAKKLIKYAYKIKGIEKVWLKHKEGLIAENKGNYSKAKQYLNCAYERSCSKRERDFLKEELDRVESKMKSHKKSGSK